MPNDPSVLFHASTLAIYLIVLLVPGLVAGLAAGIRGWVLAGIAPVLTCAIAGLAGPWSHRLGIDFSIGGFAGFTVAFTLVCWGARLTTTYLLARRGYRQPPWPTPWAPCGHVLVALGLALAITLSGYTVLSGMGTLNAISQGFDSVMHANGIRYIADTGDGGLFGMATINWYDDGGSFYPNGYHLIGALVYELSGASVPAVLNANTVLVPGLLALSVVVLIRQFRGRAVLASFAALTAVAATSATYESMYRGPLLPFVFGLALTPMVVVAVQRYLQRPGLDTGFVFAASTVGLLSVHSSMLFNAVLLSLPMLVQRWVTPARDGTGRLRRFGWELLLLLPVAATGAALAWPHLSGALALAGGDYPYGGWDAEYGAGEAWWRLVSFQHVWSHPQWALFLALALGVFLVWRLRTLFWLLPAAALFGAFFVLVASDDAEWVTTLSRPWWDDRYRLIALAMIPMTILAAHGLAEVQRGLGALLRRSVPSQWRGPGGGTGAVAGAVVLLALLAGSGGLYTNAHAADIEADYQPEYYERTGQDMPVSPDEVRAMRYLARIAGPGAWVVNDRPDGSAWMYALAGLRPIAGHFDGSMPPDDQRVLYKSFRDYPTNDKVRRVIAKRNIRYVLLTSGTIPSGAPRAPGLRDLDDQPFLDRIYRNDDAVIYRVETS